MQWLCQMLQSSFRQSVQEAGRSCVYFWSCQAFSLISCYFLPSGKCFPSLFTSRVSEEYRWYLFWSELFPWKRLFSSIFYAGTSFKTAEFNQFHRSKFGDSSSFPPVFTQIWTVSKVDWTDLVQIWRGTGEDLGVVNFSTRVRWLLAKRHCKRNHQRKIRKRNETNLCI